MKKTGRLPVSSANIQWKREGGWKQQEMEGGSKGWGEGVEVTQRRRKCCCCTCHEEERGESKAEQRERELQSDKDEFYLHEKGPHY